MFILRTSSRLDTGRRVGMPLTPWGRGDGQTAAVDHRRVLAAAQSGEEPDLDSIHEISPRLLEGGALRQTARQVGCLSDDDVELLPLLIHGILEYFGQIVP